MDPLVEMSLHITCKTDAADPEYFWALVVLRLSEKTLVKETIEAMRIVVRADPLNRSDGQRAALAMIGRDRDLMAELRRR
jgi:hypothetical protein